MNTRQPLRRALVGLLVFSCGCGQGAEEVGEDASAVPEPARFGQARLTADSTLLAHLISLSPEWSQDTIHLWSPAIRDTTSPMWGQAVHAEWEDFFRPFYGGFADGPDIFAVASTSIGAGFSAFILRIPSLYWPSALSVWVYNERDDYWLPPAAAADAFGDAGWSFQQDAWLVDRTGDGFRDLVLRRTDWDIDLMTDASPAGIIADSVQWRSFQQNSSNWSGRRGPLRDEDTTFTLAPETRPWAQP